MFLPVKRFLVKVEGLQMNESAEQAIAEMTEWVQDPDQYGVAPKSIQIAASYYMQWPWHDEEIDVHLVHYVMPNGVEGIGFSGPVAWSFPAEDVDFDLFEHDELVKLYAGWYLIFELISGDDYDPKFTPDDDAQMLELLEQEHGLADIEIVDRIKIGDQTFFEMTGTDNGEPCNLAGSMDGCFSCEAKDKFYCLPALYTFIGFAFYEEDEDENFEDA